MDIIWHGLGCFRLRGKTATVITDPYPRTHGLKLSRLESEFVTLSRDGSEAEQGLELISGHTFVARTPGEFEVAGISAHGLPVHQAAEDGSKGGLNTSFLIDIDDVRILHLGHAGELPSESAVEGFGRIDVLLVPVGGGAVYDAAKAAAAVRTLEPRFVIPMMYELPGLKLPLAPVEPFLHEMGGTAPEPQGKLSVSASAAESETTTVVVLEAKP